MEIKHILEKRNNIILGISLLSVGIVLGIGITTYLPLLAGAMNVKPQSQPVKTVDEAEVKKQALAKFYNEIITAQDKQDWATLYKLVPQSVRDTVTEAQFTAHYSEQMGKDKVVSKETIVNSIEVTGNLGTVNRTIVTCLAKDCTGKNRIEENARKPYEFVNGEWQIPDPEPSERALKATNYGYENSTQNDKKSIVNDYGYGSDNSSYAVRNWAIYLDKNLQELIRVETIIDKDKAEKSRPVVNYQPPAVIQQPDINIQQPAPVVQQNYPKNCTSNTIGSYTYTNCY